MLLTANSNGCRILAQYSAKMRPVIGPAVTIIFRINTKVVVIGRKGGLSTCGSVAARKDAEFWTSRQWGNPAKTKLSDGGMSGAGPERKIVPRDFPLQTDVDFAA